MRADAIDLELYGRRVRVVIEDRQSYEFLKARLASFLTADLAPTGFVIRVPQSRNKMYVVLDRSGLVLGRTRRAPDCLGVVLRHLEAFAPPRADTVRFRLRSLISTGNTAVLAGFPLFTDPPVIERRLEREGFRIVDRMHTDLDVTTKPSPSVVPSAVTLSVGTEPCLGHVDVLHAPVPVEAVLLPGNSMPTMARRVAQLASLTSSDSSRTERLRAAERLATLPIRLVGLDDRSARYAALRL